MAPYVNILPIVIMLERMTFKLVHYETQLVTKTPLVSQDNCYINHVNLPRVTFVVNSLKILGLHI